LQISLENNTVMMLKTAEISITLGFIIGRLKIPFDAIQVNKNILLHTIKDISCQVEVIITLKRRQEY